MNRRAQESLRIVLIGDDSGGLSTMDWVLIGLVSFGIGVGWVLLGTKVKA